MKRVSWLRRDDVRLKRPTDHPRQHFISLINTTNRAATRPPLISPNSPAAGRFVRTKQHSMHQLTPAHATLKHCPQPRLLELNERRSHAHSSSLVHHHHAQPCLPAKTPTRIIVLRVSSRLRRCSCRAADWRTFACMTLAAACELLRQLLMMQRFHDSSGRERDDSTWMMARTRR